MDPRYQIIKLRKAKYHQQLSLKVEIQRRMFMPPYKSAIRAKSNNCNMNNPKSSDVIGKCIHSAN